MNRTNWFNDLETKADMNSCAIGIIGEIMGDGSTLMAYRKLFEIARTLEALEKAWKLKNPPATNRGYRGNITP